MDPETFTAVSAHHWRDPLNTKATVESFLDTFHSTFFLSSKTLRNLTDLVRIGSIGREDHERAPPCSLAEHFDMCAVTKAMETERKSLNTDRLEDLSDGDVMT